MTNCPVCGNSINDEKFCPKCGSEIKKQNNTNSKSNNNNNNTTFDVDDVAKNFELKPVIIGVVISLIFVGISGFNVYLAIFGVFIGSLIAGYLTEQSYINAIIYGVIIGIIGSVLYWLGGFIFGYFLISALIGAFIGKYIQLHNGGLQ